MKRHAVSMAAALLSTVLLSSAGHSEEKLNIGVSNWPSIEAMASIIKQVAHDQLGLEAQLVTSTTPVIFASMDRGKGDIDVHPEIWIPNHQALVKEYVDDKKSVVMAPTAYNVIQGICTTKAMQDKYGIKSVYDLANPELAKHFSPDGKSKGKLWIGPPGWSSSKTETVRARDYGYDQYFDLSTVEESLALVDLQDSIRAGKPWVGFCYFPHHIFSQANVVRLSEPPYDAAKFKMVQPDEDPDWFAKSHIESAWPPVEIHIGYSKSLEERLPLVVPLLRNLRVTTDEVSEWTRALAIDKQSPDDFARQWVKAHANEVQGWLNK